MKTYTPKSRELSQRALLINRVNQAISTLSDAELAKIAKVCEDYEKRCFTARFKDRLSKIGLADICTIQEEHDKNEYTIKQ